jgi:hypothetical protein
MANTLIVVGLVLYILGHTLTYFTSPLKKIPGPRAATWTRLWLAYTLVSGRAGKRFVELDRQFGKCIPPLVLLSVVDIAIGPVVRIGPNHVLISDADTIRRVLAVGSRYTRGPWFDTLRMDPARNNITSERDMKKHQAVRHVLANGVCFFP